MEEGDEMRGGGGQKKVGVEKKAAAIAQYQNPRFGVWFAFVLDIWRRGWVAIINDKIMFSDEGVKTKNWLRVNMKKKRKKMNL